MPIDYALYPNNFSENPNQYTAKVITKRTVDQDDIINFIAQQGSTVSLPDILGVLELHQAAIIHFLDEGYRINTPLVNYALTIKGKFDGSQDTFDESRHTLQASLSTGSKLRKQMKRQRKMHRRHPLRNSPVLAEYKDYGSNSDNTYLTPAKPGQLIGNYLKFNPTDPEQGLYIVNKDDNSRTKVTLIMHNKATKLIFEVPASLAPGQYTIELYAAPTDDRNAQRGELYKTLTVV